MIKPPVVPSEAIVQIFTRAANSPRGISIEFKSEGEAIHFNQRYNTVRAALVKQDPTTEWRSYQMRRDGKTLFLEPTDAHVMKLDIQEL